YAPSSDGGRRLLAHELTHVVQQSAAPSGAPAMSRPGDASEREADAVAERVIAAGHAAPAVRVTQQVSRQIARKDREADMPDYWDPRAPMPRVRPAHQPPGGLPALEAASASGKPKISPTALTREDIKEIMNPLPPEAGALDPKIPAQ